MIRSIYAFLAVTVVAGGTATAQTSQRAESYPYGGKTFTHFVSNSYRGEKGNAQDFYDWMSRAVRQNTALFPGDSTKDLPARLSAERSRLAALPDAKAKAEVELRIAEQLHKAVKTVIPKFSLERGYEFRYTVQRGERQCLLQSVLMAGMMQAMGMNAGAFMVWKSETGSESNNGHVVSVLKLADGKDVLVDCSDPHPIAKQQGLFVWNGAEKRYRFVEPVYTGDKGIISGYKTHGTSAVLPSKNVRPLDVSFLDSQFDFYRGEHTPGGLLHTPRTPSGLEQEMRYLRRAVRAAPQNPLAVYMLGRVYLKQNNLGAARSCLTRAYALYSSAGRVPQGTKDAMKELNIALRRMTPTQTASARP